MFRSHATSRFSLLSFHTTIINMDSFGYFENDLFLPLPLYNMSQSLPPKIALETVSFSRNLCHISMSFVHTLTWQSVLLQVTACSVLYMLSLAIYRLYFSPVAHFPGPFLAKVTHWYEFYYNFIRTGEYYLKIRGMHDKYGMMSHIVHEYSIHG